MRHPELILLLSAAAAGGVLLFARRSSAATSGGQLRGVNLAGAEFGENYPGVEGQDYTWPTLSEVDYFKGTGMNVVRVNFQWERLQPQLGQNFADDYFRKLDGLVQGTTGRGVKVLLNPQNFARYRGAIIGTRELPNAAFSDLWARLASHYKRNPGVLIGLMNEPHDMPTEQWVSAANDAIVAIRNAGAGNVISVPGNAWTGAHSWTQDWYGTPNAKALLAIKDPRDNFVIEVHNYFDEDGGGGGKECKSPTIGSERMKEVTGWARKNGKRLLVAEFGAPDTPTCKKATEDFLRFARDNSDVIVGWIWWAAGPDWQDYPLSIEPAGGQPKPQQAWIDPFLRR